MSSSGGRGQLAIPGQYTLERDYGVAATGNPVVTTALQNAVNDVASKGGGSILLANRTYNFDSIVWPAVPLSGPPTPIEFVGPFKPITVGYMPGVGLTYQNGGDVLAQTKGAILKATLASGSAFGGLSAWSNIMPVFRNVIVRVPANPQWHGIDCGWCTNLVCDGVVVDQGRSWGDGSNPASPGPIVQSTNAGVEGIIYPGAGNGGVTIGRDVLITGYYNGFRHSEHFDGDRITVAKCVVAYRPADGWHSARIGRMSLYWNQVGVQPVRFDSNTPVTRLHIDELDFEEDAVGGNWYTTTYHVNDPNNYLRGRIGHHRMVPAAGPTPVLLRRGAAYANLSSIASPHSSTIDAVGFEGANSTTTLPASVVGQAPTQLRGTWGINGQRAYIATVSGSTAGDLAVWDCGANQVTIHTRFVVNTSGLLNAGIAFMAIDNANYVFAVLNGANGSIQKVDTSVYTTLANASAFAAVAGQEIDLKVSILGKTIRFYANGNLIATYTMTAAEWTKYSVGTQHGFFAYTGGGYEPGGANGSRWGFLRIERIAPVMA